MVIWQSYDHCVILAYGCQKQQLRNRQTGYSSAILAQIKK